MRVLGAFNSIRKTRATKYGTSIGRVVSVENPRRNLRGHDSDAGALRAAVKDAKTERAKCFGCDSYVPLGFAGSVALSQD